MVSIQAGDDLPSDGDAELHVSPEKLNGHGLPHSPEHQPILSAVGGTSKSSPVRKPPTDLKDDELEDSTTEEDYLFGEYVLAEKTKKKRWISIYVMFFMIFLSSVTFSITLSSIWPYLLEVDYKNASAKFLGWVVAAFSFGQLIASPFFGFWGDKRPTREPLIIALLINIIFNVLYSYCGAFQSGLASWMMLVSRAMVGFAAGVAAVVRSYVSEATTEKERIGALAGISSAQGLGFILGPALGLAFVPLGYEGLKIDAIKFRFNMYTGPGYLSALLGLIIIFLFIFVFRESKLTKARKRKKMTKAVEYEGSSVQSNRRMKRFFAGCPCCRSASDNSTGVYSSLSTSMGAPSQKPFDKLAAVITLFLFFITLFVFSVFETLGSPLSMDEFAWTKKQAVLYNNLLYVGLSVISIIAYILVKFIAKKIDERVILMVSLFITAFGYFAMLPMTDTPPKVALSGLLASDRTRNHSESWIHEPTPNLTIETVGCRDPPQTWCSEVGHIYLFQYIIALILLSVGFSGANLITFSTYSKILGPFPQGVMMGLLTGAGSLARGVGPLVITLLYQHKGPGITFATVDGLIGFSIIVFLIFCRRLVPYRPGPSYKAIA